ncbi:MAG: formylglycine-generating enzyme family protein, partial [Anaerolineae bacterium]
MVTIPAGEFEMGCDAAHSAAKCAADATPLHAVYLASFKIDKYEVTNAQYAACVKAGKCPAQASATSNT